VVFRGCRLARHEIHGTIEAMAGETEEPNETSARPGMLTPICMGCGEVSIPHCQHDGTCYHCGTSFKDRPPSSYAAMEGFLEFGCTHVPDGAGCPERTLESRTLERWLAFSFSTGVILLGLLAMIRT